MSMIEFTHKGNGMTLALTQEAIRSEEKGKKVITNMAKGNPQIDNLIKQHQDQLRKDEIKAELKRKEPEGKGIFRARAPFEGSCTSMNRNETHTKTFRKTAKALLKV